MPYRKVPIVVGEIYHVFNRSVARQPIFLNNKAYQRALETLYFYSFSKQNLRFSHYNRLPQLQKAEFLQNLKLKAKRRIQMYAYCLMPNHVHFLIKEIEERGISTFMSNFQESFAKYFNIREDRTGSLFQSMFKAVRIESDEQFLHVSRYIHLNPLTSFVIKDIAELETYSWCSFGEYLREQDQGIIDKDKVLSYFSSIKHFKSFTLDQVDYQRKLAKIKHLILE